jgi:DNA-binding CsgD family transcriptional regulator/PAS domain-containing protein
MSLDDGVSQLIGRIYESAHDSEQWNLMLEDVRRRLELRCLFQSLSRLDCLEMQRGVVLGEPKRAEGQAEYLAYWYQHDPSFLWAAANPRARFCATEDIIPKEDYLQSEFIRWQRDELIGSTHWFVGYTAPDDELTFGLSAHPFAEDGPLAPDRQTLFRLLFDHMERAARLAVLPPRLLSNEEALLLLDKKGQVRQLSPAAEQLLESGDGLRLQRGRLHAADPDSHRRLEEAVGAAVGAVRTGMCGGAALIAHSSGCRPYLVTTSLLPAADGPFADFAPAVLLRIVATTKGHAGGPERLTSLFGLTRREGQLAEAVIAGHSLESASESLQISKNTARVHLQSLFRKTGTSRQSELVRLLIELSR